jgi:retinol dehydrogenase 12
MSTTPATAMRGKTVLITGANSGIGLETARALAQAGAHLILVCRDRSRGAAARDDIAAHAVHRAPDLFLADLFSQADIRGVAADISDRYDHLDVAVNNAGGVFAKRELTIDGMEKTFALNHLAPFLLTYLLLDLVKAAPQGRIVTVSSEIHAGDLDWDNLQSEKRHQFLKAYKVTKTENILFTNELARRLRNTKVTANAVSPGPSRTGFGDNLTGAAAAFPKIMKKMPFFHSAVQGSQVVLYAATQPELAEVTGEFFMRNAPRRSKPITHSQEAASRLWRVSERLTGLGADSDASATRI